jgi:hypothetical protein
MHSDYDPWRWRLRLFASADLVGSTAYKAIQNSRESPDWVPTFTEFFQAFPDAVVQSYSTLPKHSSHCPEVGSVLKPWKFLGDEILFSVELQRHEHAASHIRAFLKAIGEFPENWRRKKLPLRLKGSSWIAGFPITNREVAIPIPDGRKIQDFIGPSIDLGFRIAKYSTERKFVLSADLALMLLDAADRTEWETEFYPVFQGREVLKGVIGNEGYPIVFLHTNGGVQDAEEKLLGIHHHCDRTALKEFLRKFIDEREPRLFRPFISGDPDPKYGRVPDRFETLRAALQAEESNRGYTDSIAEQEPPVSGPTAVPSEPRSPTTIVK